jgi:polar amino acid transport system substrate-binding protein
MTNGDKVSKGLKFMKGFATLSYSLLLLYLIVSMTAISSLASDQAVTAKDLIYITEQLPPYNFQENGKLQGISVDLLESVWERMGENLNKSVIEILPWNEGYQRALNDKNTVLFAMARSPEREHLFKWAGPIGSTREVLLAKGIGISVSPRQKISIIIKSGPSKMI